MFGGWLSGAKRWVKGRRWAVLAGYALGIAVEVAAVAVLAGAAYLLMWLIETVVG